MQVLLDMKPMAKHYLSQIVAWPLWTVILFSTLLLILFIMNCLFPSNGPTKGKNNPRKRTSSDSDDIGFMLFQNKYLNVYYLVMYADWLQGTNMYTLYQVRITYKDI